MNENHILQIISHKCKNSFNEQFTPGSLRSDLYDEERESDKANLDLCTIIVDQLSLENCEFRWKVSGFWFRIRPRCNEVSLEPDLLL